MENAASRPCAGEIPSPIAKADRQKSRSVFREINLRVVEHFLRIVLRGQSRFHAFHVKPFERLIVSLWSNLPCCSARANAQVQTELADRTPYGLPVRVHIGQTMILAQAFRRRRT